MSQEPYNAGDPKAVKAAKRKAYNMDEKMLNGITKICNDPDTRYVLAQFWEQARIFHSNFNSNPTDHAFNEGFRSAGLWWMNNALLHEPGILAKMQTDKDSPLQAVTLNDGLSSSGSNYDSGDNDTSE